ncbi:MAG: N-6 DNA methylase [Verrucomicrobiae bacterium]|nr:N-6 DNA methylase [Verrucomicrobiae bacterium]
MLDTDTKRRIDSARDILVGKVPDPKSQVEQITIALIYKFMDDMDAESEELGGERSFFTGDFARYGWAKLMHGGLGGHETLALYAEGITKMTENANLPPLFRDIFKNAFLPYRDPETLRAFLKIIDEFSYDHSERLGDAFEYLLSVLGSQGDAGQFRTPRHLIDFIVALVDPKKDETVLDPACGTAGFLISAYKHILTANRDAKGHSTLTPDDRQALARNFKGYDISPDMVRLSLVNLYLHGFTDPHIYEYDTLTDEARWNEFADVILANPPFMSPKGGIRPHKRFSIPAKRSEVLFVDYMAEHLTPGGRAGIIVPEGIIFQSQTAYKSLRKMLVESCLVGVVSLPAGVFQPYSGVKTSILLFDKTLAKRARHIAFFKIENDGHGLGAQRRPIDKDDLPQVRADVETYLAAQRRGASDDELESLELVTGLVVPKTKVAANGEYQLSGERYRESEIRTHEFPLVHLGEACSINPSKKEVLAGDPDTLVSFVPMADLGENRISFAASDQKTLGEVGASYTYFENDDVLLAKVTPCFENGKAGIARNLVNGIGFGSSEFYVLRAGEDVLPEWIYYCVTHPIFRDPAVAQMTGTGGLQRVPRAFVSEFEIPLPPLEVQREIVAEIEGYQKVIDGARAVLDHYRPHIPIHPDWPMVELGEVCEVKSGGTPSRSEESYWNGSIPWIGSTVCKDSEVFAAEEFITEAGLRNSAAKLLPKNTTLIALVGATIGKTGLLRFESTTNQNVAGLMPRSASNLNPIYLFHAAQQLYPEFLRLGEGKFRMANLSFVRERKIPLPPPKTQQAIVAEIEAEQALVAANRELIDRMEAKIQATLARVWGDENAEAAAAVSPTPADSTAAA